MPNIIILKGRFSYEKLQYEKNWVQEDTDTRLRLSEGDIKQMLLNDASDNEVRQILMDMVNMYIFDKKNMIIDDCTNNDSLYLEIKENLDIYNEWINSHSYLEKYTIEIKEFTK